VPDNGEMIEDGSHRKLMELGESICIVQSAGGEVFDGMNWFNYYKILTGSYCIKKVGFMYLLYSKLCV